MADTPTEFLVVNLPERVEPGATLRLLAIESTLNAAKKAVDELEAGTLGRVTVLERKALYRRQPAVENIELTDPIAK